jgi:hypothetical protein
MFELANVIPIQFVSLNSPGSLSLKALFGKKIADEFKMDDL